MQARIKEANQDLIGKHQEEIEQAWERIRLLESAAAEKDADFAAKRAVYEQVPRPPMTLHDPP